MKITLTKILKRKFIETAKTNIKQERELLEENKDDQFQVWKFDGDLNKILATKIHYNKELENVLEDKFIFSLEETLKHFQKNPFQFFDLSNEEIWNMVEKSLINNEIGIYMFNEKNTVHQIISKNDAEKNLNLN